MATNRIYEHGYRKSFVPDDPAAPVSGSLVRVGTQIGVALTNPDDNDYVTVSFHGVYKVPVEGSDGKPVAVEIGDLLYFTDSSGQLDKVTGSATLAGYAWDHVDSGDTASIAVKLLG
jgi:predicted RecA/RadA family phage recombinase